MIEKGKKAAKELSKYNRLFRKAAKVENFAPPCNRVWASGLHYFDIDFFVRNYFLNGAEGEGLDIKSVMRMAVGSKVHRVIQNDILCKCPFAKGTWQLWDKESHTGEPVDEVGPFESCPQEFLDKADEWRYNISYKEHRIHTPYNVTGKVDAFFDVDGELIPVEIKTVTARWYDVFQTCDQIFDSYRKQLEVYSEHLGVDGAFLLVDKVGWRSKLLRYRSDFSMLKTSMKDVQTAHEMIRALDIPGMTVPEANATAVAALAQDRDKYSELLTPENLDDIIDACKDLQTKGN